MSLQEKIQDYKRQAIVEYLRENPDVTFGTFLEDEDSDVVDVFLALTPEDLTPATTKTKTKTKRKPRNKTRDETQAPKRSHRPQKSKAQTNSDYMRWAAGLENGVSVTMAEITSSSGLSAAQFKRANKEFGWFESHGKGPGTTYVFVRETSPEEEDEEQENAA